LDGSILRTQGEVALTSIAPEIVNVSCAAPDRTEACSRFVFNPATRALEIAPAYRDKAAKALMRELRRTKLRLYFTLRVSIALSSRSKAAARCRACCARPRAISRIWSSKIFSKSGHLDF
jgi:hypothetical protein